MGFGDRRRQERRQRSDAVNEDRRRSERRVADRRVAERVPLELWMEEVSGDDVYFRRSGNLGEGGVYFDKAVPHTLGTMVTLKFALPGETEMVVARGKVVSGADVEGSLGMGVKFIAVEGNGRHRIRIFIRRVA